MSLDFGREGKQKSGQNDNGAQAQDEVMIEISFGTSHVDSE